MQTVRSVERGERIADLYDEMRALTFNTGHEHALVKFASGGRAIVSGGSRGINRQGVNRLYTHTHP